MEYEMDPRVKRVYISALTTQKCLWLNDPDMRNKEIRNAYHCLLRDIVEELEFYVTISEA